MAKGKTRDLYQEVTDRILELLDAGTVPWRNPIQRGGGQGWPKNLDSGKRYRGINVFLLASMAWAKGYGSDYWITFKQAQKANGAVRKGEKSSLVVFWKQYATKDRETGEEITIPVLKHYNVFNVEQCDGLQPPDAPTIDPNTVPFEPLDRAEAIVAGYRDKPSISHGGSRAFYRPRIDEIRIADPERFSDRENYYATLFHELVHSTGHSKRLNRGLDTNLTPFGSPDYSKEELIAEMGAAFLAAVAGISPPTIEQSAAYIDGWQKQLKGDKRLVVSAAGAAQKAADWILGESFTEAVETTVVETPIVAERQKEARTADSQLKLFQ
ncbi:ArdC family protein [Lignipirellula cremea]|uniref:DNA primase TraC n=1 Tax=Lignipirellula cremea TaxID=2528010 RepID=A0A518E3F7_9BACT|nr:ArdC-like ssDNA-binding domain-containing protein [Lignipirellula cremea]QDU98602.1 DNA primase TraC [Lignipirellula cremea]